MLTYIYAFTYIHIIFTYICKYTCKNNVWMYRTQTHPIKTLWYIHILFLKVRHLVWYMWHILSEHIFCIRTHFFYQNTFLPSEHISHVFASAISRVIYSYLLRIFARIRCFCKVCVRDIPDRTCEMCSDRRNVFW